MDVSSVGGVFSGSDAFSMILAGASAVQVGTCHWKEGPQCFDRIVKELSVILKARGYKSVSEAKGQLQAWSKEGASKSRASAKKTTSTISEASADSVGAASEAQLYKMLSVFLVIFIAILLTDRFHVRLLPFE